MKESELIEQIKQGHNAWHLLCEDYKAIVQSIAKQYMRAGNGQDELIEAGNYGLLQAACQYDVSRGFKFFAFAICFVRKAIEKAVADKLSQNDFAFAECGVVLSDRESQILNAYFYGEPSLEEVRSRLDLTPERFDHILNKALLKIGITKE